MTDRADYAFDDLDRCIVALLKADGRMTNRDIARQIGATRVVVGTRIQRMTELGALRIVAAADFAAYDFNVLVALAISVTGRPAEAVGAELAAISDIFAVHLVTGAHQLEVLVAVHDFQDLSTRVMHGIAAVTGVGQIDVGIATDIVAYNFDVGISR